MVEPDRVADDVGWESIAVIVRRLAGHVSTVPAPAQLDNALVFLRPAFADAVEYVVAEVPEGLRADVRGFLQQLCEPDPIRRGHPLERRPGGNSFSLERYVAKLDLLARRAELVFTKAS